MTPTLWTRVLAQMPVGAIIAGGAVRDHFLGVEPKDIDVFVGGGAAIWNGFPDGFSALPDSERRAEYEAQPQISWVQRGVIEGVTVDLIGADLSPFSGAALMPHFDFAITRSWFDGTAIHDTPEALADRVSGTVTRLIHTRPERAQTRFDRFNAKMGGTFRYITGD